MPASRVLTAEYSERFARAAAQPTRGPRTAGRQRRRSQFRRRSGVLLLAVGTALIGSLAIAPQVEADRLPAVEQR